MKIEDYLNILKEVKLPLELKTKIFIEGFQLITVGINICPMLEMHFLSFI